MSSSKFQNTVIVFQKFIKGHRIRKSVSLIASVGLLTTMTMVSPAAASPGSLDVTSEAELITDVAISGAVISIKNDISLSTVLYVTANVTIHGNGFTLSGSGIQTQATVSMDNITLTGAIQSDANYGVWVQSGSLIADNIIMTLNTSSSDGSEIDSDGFNVATGASLNLTNSTLTWGSLVTGDGQYGVYSQSGATAVALSGNTFNFNTIVDPTDPWPYISTVLGMQSPGNNTFTNLTFGSNTYSDGISAVDKLLMYGADTAAQKQTFAASHLATGEILGDSNSDRYPIRYTKNASSGFDPRKWAIAGVSVPVTGGTPAAFNLPDAPLAGSSGAADLYNATVTWSGTPTLFASSTVYTATIL